MVRRSLIKEFCGQPRPHPWHTFVHDELRRLLGGAEDPAFFRLIDERILASIVPRLRQRYALHLETATHGVSTSEEMLSYLDGAGLLQELSLARAEAREAIAAINPVERLLLPRDEYTAYAACRPPMAPVRFPAEFEPVGAVILGWPLYYPYCWRSHSRLVEEIVSEALALVVVPNEEWQRAVELYLDVTSVPKTNLRFLYMPLDDVWTRDYGPTGVLAGPDAVPTMIANPYYMHYMSYQKLDAEVPYEVARCLGTPIHKLPLVIEGGNLLSDGRGTLVMSDEVFDANPDVDRPKLDRILHDFFGCERLILVPRLLGEATGHVDLIAKFLDEDTVLVGETEAGTRWHSEFEQACELLAGCESSRGRPYEVIRVPCPPNRDQEAGVWGYVNSLIVNSKVIVPVFGVAEDEQALGIYRTALPQKTVVGIDFRVFPLGSVHCQTKDLPAPFRERLEPEPRPSGR